jgi:hypothetical protein
MAGRRINGAPLFRWEHTQYGVDPRRDDASSTWSPEQLARRDSDFCTRVRIAFRAGGESMNAAAATSTYQRDALVDFRVVIRGTR